MKESQAAKQIFASQVNRVTVSESLVLSCLVLSCLVSRSRKSCLYAEIYASNAAAGVEFLLLHELREQSDGKCLRLDTPHTHCQPPPDRDNRLPLRRHLARLGPALRLRPSLQVSPRLSVSLEGVPGLAQQAIIMIVWVEQPPPRAFKVAPTTSACSSAARGVVSGLSQSVYHSITDGGPPGSQRSCQ